MDVILQALVDGSKAFATDAATDALRSIYNQLKSSIQEQWVGTPPASQVLDEFGKDPETWKGIMEKKLKESGISEDVTVREQARLVIEECTRTQNRKSSPGDTITDRAMTQKGAKIRSEGDVISAVGNITKTVVHNHSVPIAIAIVAVTVAICYSAYVTAANWSSPTSNSPPSPNSSPLSNSNQNNIQNDIQNNSSFVVPAPGQPQSSNSNVSGTQRSSSSSVGGASTANSNNQQCLTPQQQQLENNRSGQPPTASSNEQQCPTPQQ